MENKNKLFNLYEDYEGKRPYTGTGNFPKGKKECPKCKGLMIRIPLKQPYVDSGNNFILVDTSPSTGILKVSNIEPVFSWFCQECNYAGPSIPARPKVIVEE